MIVQMVLWTNHVRGKEFWGDRGKYLPTGKKEKPDNPKETETVMSSPASQKKYRVVLLGESGCGKRSLVLPLVKDEWIPNPHSTVGASFFRYTATVDDLTVNFDIWDTAGQERYKSLASMYYRGKELALVVYDITSLDSFDRAKYWIRELMANSPQILIMVVGNKCDLEEQRRVPREDAKKYADECGLLHFETSVKDRTRVKVVFQEAARKLALCQNAPPVPAGGVVERARTSKKTRASWRCLLDVFLDGSLKKKLKKILKECCK